MGLPLTPNPYHPDLPPAPLWRRLAAAVYDFMLLFALWMLVGALAFAFYNMAGLPLEESGRPPFWFQRGVLLPLLLLATWGFFAWFWLHGGQTLGMRAWRLVARDWLHGPMNLPQTVARFIGGTASWLAFGLGYLLVLVRPYQSFHDRLSRTETVLMPKSEKQKGKQAEKGQREDNRQQP